MADEPEIRSYNFRRRKVDDRTTPIMLPGLQDGDDDVEFHYRPGHVNALVAMNIGEISAESNGMKTFLRQGFGDEYDALWAYLTSPLIDIQADDFAEMIKDLVTEAAELPTVPSSSSTAGRHTRSPGSTGRSTARG